MYWKVLDTGPGLATEVMQRDVQLFQNLETQQQGILHFYDWLHPAATYGCFVDPKKILLTTEGLDLGKRLTGGGITFHVADFAFSVIVPASHSSFSSDPSKVLRQYQYVNGLVSRALNGLFPKNYEILQQEDASIYKDFCMTKGTKYDLLSEGKKAVGAAQRRKKFGYLHQGSISLAVPRIDFLQTYLPSHLIEKMLQFTFSPLGESWDIQMLKDAREQLKAKLIEVFQEEEG